VPAGSIVRRPEPPPPPPPPLSSSNLTSTTTTTTPLPDPKIPNFIYPYLDAIPASSPSPPPHPYLTHPPPTLPQQFARVLRVATTVRNTGARAGAAVAQLYVTHPLPGDAEPA